jgi:hypothetical protein
VILGELFAADERQTLEFFFSRLQDVSGPEVDREELLYNASVLAHYALVSTESDQELPAPASLSAVFDHFVIDATLLHDGFMMETAGGTTSAGMQRSVPVSTTGRPFTNRRRIRRGSST